MTDRPVYSCGLIGALLVGLVGCSEPAANEVEAPANTNPPQQVASQPPTSRPVETPPTRKPSGLTLPGSKQEPPETRPSQPQPDDPPKEPPPLQLPQRQFSPLVELEPARLRASGVQVIEGKHLVLLTDVPVRLASQETLQELVTVFDAAYPLWCQKLQLEATPWKVRAHLFHNPQRFQDLGLWRDELPDFKFGYAFPDAIWAKELGLSEYYRRHLLLHEGVHALMFSRYGSCGPSWYMEGLAELLASHRWDGRQLEVGTYPRSREEAEGLGRIELVRETIEDTQSLAPEQVMSLRGSVSWPLQNYGWAWAFASFLAHHPSYRDRFWELPAHVAKPTFDQHVQYQLFGEDWQELRLDWQFYLRNLCYHYDFEQAGIDYSPGQPLPASGAVTQVPANRLWVNSGIEVQAGKRYRIAGRGRFVIASGRATEPPQWVSEANGISFRYEKHRPLGMLLGCVISSQTKQVEPFAIGREHVIQPTANGTLFLRVNDSAGELAENAGALEVTIRLAP